MKPTKIPSFLDEHGELKPSSKEYIEVIFQTPFEAFTEEQKHFALEAFKQLDALGESMPPYDRPSLLDYEALGKGREEGVKAIEQMSINMAEYMQFLQQQTATQTIQMGPVAELLEIYGVDSLEEIEQFTDEEIEEIKKANREKLDRLKEANPVLEEFGKIFSNQAEQTGITPGQLMEQLQNAYMSMPEILKNNLMGQLDEDDDKDFLDKIKAARNNTLSTLNENIGNILYGSMDAMHAFMPPANIQTILPENALINTSKPSRSIFSGDIPVDGKPRRIKNLGTVVALNYEGLGLENLKDKLEPSDLIYYDAVSALLEENDIVTIGAIHRQATGKRGKEGAGVKVSPNQEEAIRKSLDKLSQIKATIDISGEKYKNRKGEEVELVDMTDRLYNFAKLRGLVNGQMTEYYKFHSLPLLYIYALRRKQLARMPIQLLDADINNTMQNMTLKRYILSQIEFMKSNPKRRSSKMLIDTIIEEAALFTEEEKEKPSFRTQKKRVVDNIKTFLDHLVSEEYIRAYEIEKKGKSNHAFMLKI